MLKEKWRLIARIERIGDFFIIVLAFFVAYYVRAWLPAWNDAFHWGLPFSGEKLAPIRDYYAVLAIALLAYVVLLNVMGSYSSMRLSTNLHLIKTSVVSSLLVFFIVAAALFLLKLDLSRAMIVIFCFIVALSLAAERYLVLEFLRFWRRRGRNFRNIIVCGTGSQARTLAREIRERPELGIRIRAFADLADLRAREPEKLVEFKQELRKSGMNSVGRVLSGCGDLERAVKDYAIDEVIFTDVIEVMAEVEGMIHVCAEQGIRTTIAADLFSVGMVQSQMSFFGGMPLIHFQTPPGDRWELSIKRTLDIIISATALIVLLPVFGIIALAIQVSSPGPVFFRQKRVGQSGRLFALYKFRSMVLDAEEQLTELLESNEMDGPVFKMKHDPRITWVGRFLRRFSLDELPQLWNVLTGDMSLVGPRPPVPGEVNLYERKDRRRLSMRPGLTCIWQVSGRNEIKDFSSWVKMDLEYIDNWSLQTDFKLLLQTIPAVLFGAGAR